MDGSCDHIEALVNANLAGSLCAEDAASFRIENGELVWGDYALCFPMTDLYRNCIGSPSLLEAA